MILDQQVVIPAAPGRVWEFLTDMPAVSRCVPGVESIEQIDADTYLGTLTVRVGPIAVRLQGKVFVAERDRENLRASFQIQATDKRLNSSVTARATLTLVPRSETETEFRIHTESSILGKLGEFGQAVMRRKAGQVVGEFAKNMARTLATSA